MSTQHTQGTWIARPSNDGSGDVGIGVQGQGCLAECFADIRHQGERAVAEAQANARLIVAAQDLLAALDHVFACLPIGDVGRRIFPTSGRHAADLNAALDQGRAALAKAAS